MESWAQINEWLGQLLEQSPTEQDLFLREKESRYPEMVETVRHLLSQHLEAEQYFNRLQLDLADQLLAAESDPPLQAGQQLGSYTIDAELGKGGMAIVYSAKRSDGQFEQEVAIKVVKKNLNTEDAFQRFRYERQLLAGLNHPNIARLFDGGTTDQGLPYLVMEKVSGNTLSDYLEQNTLSFDQRYRLVDQIIQAVNYAHRHRIVHGDLKPSNIVVDQQLQVKLLDFGIATIVEDEGQAHAIFTPDYGSPEHWKAKTLLPASDIFQLGLIITKVMVNVNPLQMVEDKQHWDLRKLKSVSNQLFQKKLNYELMAIISQCLQPDPQMRYENAFALSQDWHALQQKLPLRAIKPSVIYVAKKLVQRNRLVVASLFVSFVLIVSLSVAYVYNLNQEKQEALRQKKKAEQYSDFMTELFAGSDPYHADTEYLSPNISLREFLQLKGVQLDQDSTIDAELKYKLSLLLADAYMNLTEDSASMNQLVALKSYSSKQFGSNSDQMAGIWFRIGKLYTYQALYDSATWAFEQANLAIQNTTSPNTFLQAQIANNLGLNYHFEGRFEEAEKLYQQSKELFGPYDPSDVNVISNLNNYAQLMRMTGRYAEAKALSEQVLDRELTRVKGDSTNLFVIQKFSDYILILMEIGDYEPALKLSRFIIEEQDKKMGENHHNSEVFKQNYATLLMLSGQYQLAGEAVKALLMKAIQREGYTSYNSLYLVKMYAEYAFIMNDEAKVAPYLASAMHVINQVFPAPHMLKSLLLLDASLLAFKQKQFAQSEIYWQEANSFFEANLPSNHYRVAYAKALKECFDGNGTIHYLDSLKNQKANVNRYIRIIENLQAKP